MHASARFTLSAIDAGGDAVGADVGAVGALSGAEGVEHALPHTPSVTTSRRARGLPGIATPTQDGHQRVAVVPREGLHAAPNAGRRVRVVDARAVRAVAADLEPVEDPLVRMIDEVRAAELLPPVPHDGPTVPGVEVEIAQEGVAGWDFYMFVWVSFYPTQSERDTF